MKELSFLMQDHGHLFQALFLEEERYKLAVYLVEEHRRIVLQEAWPRLEKAGMKMGDNSTNLEIEKILGPGTFRQLQVTTSAIITNIDQNAVSLKKAFKNLRPALKAIYPEKKFIDFKFDA